MMRFAKNNFNSQQGFIALIIAILILVTMVTISVSISNIVISQHKISANITKSSQSYFAAEAGIEDSIYRIIKGKQYQETNSLAVGNGTAKIRITTENDEKIIESTGEILQRFRKLKTVLVLSATKAGFHYGAQVGDWGLQMRNNSRIRGNVFSNGNAIGLDPNVFIDNSITVARNGNKIAGLKIGQVQDTPAPADAKAYSCDGCQIKDTLTYVEGGTVKGCQASEIKFQSEEIEPKDLPISYSQIQEWEEDAKAGGVISGNYTPAEGSSLGPKKIEGNLTFPKNSLDNPVIITGPIWVTGKILAINNAGIKLKPGLRSGYPIIADDPDDQENNGKIGFNNNVVTTDSEAGGKLLFISTNKSLNFTDPAILLNNNVNKRENPQSIIFSLQGLILVNNNVYLNQITGYGIYMNNNAEIVYEIGLADASFSSGPGGGWQVSSWQEVE